MGAKLLNCFCWSVQKLHIGQVGSTSSSSSSRADNYNAYHKLAVAVAEVWGSAIGYGVTNLTINLGLVENKSHRRNACLNMFKDLEFVVMNIVYWSAGKEANNVRYHSKNNN